MATDYERIAKHLNKICADWDAGGFYNMLKPYLPIIKKLEKTIVFKPAELSRTSLTLEQMEDLALEFYGELGHGFKEKIINTLNGENVVIRKAQPAEKSGVLAVGISKKSPNEPPVLEVDLHPANTSNGMVTVTHEYGHLLDSYFRRRRFPKTDCLREVETMFFEQVFIDWLLDKDKISKSEHAQLKQQRVNNLHSEVYQILAEAEFAERLGVPITAKALQEWDEELLRSGDEEKRKYIKDCLSHIFPKEGEPLNYKGGEYKFRYVFGEIVSRAMYKDYKADPETTLTRLATFLEKSGSYDFNMKKAGDSCRTAEQINQEEIKTCLTDLLGEKYLQKLNAVVAPRQVDSGEISI